MPEINIVEKIQQSNEAWNHFFNQFGEPDIYSCILLETIIEELFKQRKDIEKL